MVKKYLVLIFFIVITIRAFTDEWLDAKIIIAYSQNKEYMLEVYPRKYPDNSHPSKYCRQYKKEIVRDTISPCHAVLYRISNSDTTQIWNRYLVNFTSPVKVLIANNGKSVVTIDDWGMAGYKHTMVVYGETGEVIKDFDLEDITPFPIEQYSRSISSISWGGYGEYLDNDRIEMHFQNELGEKKKRIFNITSIKFE